MWKNLPPQPPRMQQPRRAKAKTFMKKNGLWSCSNEIKFSPALVITPDCCSPWQPRKVEGEHRVARGGEAMIHLKFNFAKNFPTESQVSSADSGKSFWLGQRKPRSMDLFGFFHSWTLNWGFTVHSAAALSANLNFVLASSSIMSMKWAESHSICSDALHALHFPRSR